MDSNVMGFSVARGPGMKTMVTPITKDSPLPYMPEDLPTYRRLHCIHLGDPVMEVQMRAASVEDSCMHLETENPPSLLTGAIFRTGSVSDEQAEELRQYTRSLDEDDEYLRDELLLLLEAGGHLMEQDTPQSQENESKQHTGA